MTKKYLHVVLFLFQYAYCNPQLFTVHGSFILVFSICGKEFCKETIFFNFKLPAYLLNIYYMYKICISGVHTK